MADQPPNELGELLALLHGANAAFETIEATYRIWTHTERAHAAFQAKIEQDKRRGPGVSRIALFDNGDPTPDEQVQTIRLWRAGARFREEFEGGPRHRFYSVRDGDLWWHWDEHNGAVSNEDDPTVTGGPGKRLSAMLDPTRLLGLLSFRPLGHSAQAGRRTITVEARPRQWSHDGSRQFELYELGGGADRYILEVDRERGVLLDVVALRNGEPFNRVSVLAISFDEPIADERFVFVPPPGEEIRRASDGPRPPQHVPLTEAQQRAPFTVLMPGHVPADWQMHCLLAEPFDRPRMPLHVVLQYRSRSGHETVSLSQFPLTDRPEQYDLMLAGEHWEAVVRDGATVRVNRESSRGLGPRQAQACVERDGTFVFLTSDTLSAEQLTRIAAGLVPAPSESGI